MSNTSAPSAPQLPPSPQNVSGVRSVLRYTGIPESWIKRPKLPSRNWLIFLGTVSSVVGAYAYDRRRCRQIREEYVRRVEHYAQEPMSSTELPRKVTVYAAKWPGDDDWSRSMKYFKKYVKPVLVGAAIDYEIVSGRRHGELAREVANRITSQRRIAAGQDKPAPHLLHIPTTLSPEQETARMLQGGSIIVGRQTLKEYMEGLKRGWTQGLKVVDSEEEVIQALDDDGRFDEPEEESTFSSGADVDDEPIPTASRLQAAQTFSPLKLPSAPISQQNEASIADVPPPASIPPQPPLLLVPFTNYIGFLQIPNMIYDFFTQRHKVQAGAECAYRLVRGHTRPFAAAHTPLFSEMESSANDLAFDRIGESHYKNSLRKFESDIDKERSGYYKELPSRLATARALARGTRAPTKDEMNYPPPTEVELRAERLKKEVRWRGDLEGWHIVRPDSEIVWDERFDGVLRVFVDPPQGLDERRHDLTES